MQLVSADQTEGDLTRLFRHCLFCGRRITASVCACGARFVRSATRYLLWTRHLGLGYVVFSQARALGVHRLRLGRNLSEWVAFLLGAENRSCLDSVLQNNASNCEANSGAEVSSATTEP